MRKRKEFRTKSGFMREGRRHITSVSSVLSNSVALPLPDPPLPPRSDAAPVRCNPAFSRSLSVQDKTEARRESISKRLLSERGVVRKESMTFVTRRLGLGSV